MDKVKAIIGKSIAKTEKENYGEPITKLLVKNIINQTNELLENSGNENRVYFDWEDKNSLILLEQGKILLKPIVNNIVLKITFNNGTH